MLGKRIDSGAQGRIAGYQSRNDIKASLMRDDEGLGAMSRNIKTMNG